MTTAIQQIPGKIGPGPHLLVIVAICLCLIGCKKKENKPAPPPPDVLVVTVQPTNVPIYAQWIGVLDGLVNAQIRAQVTGYILKQDYLEGSQVKKGDLLFEIDPRPFQAVLNQAEAKLAQDQAQYTRTQLDVKRYTPLAKQSAISQQELDNAIAANLAARAQVQADEAAVETARLNLGFTKIISPIDGVAGTARAQIGDLVGPNSSNPLTTVSTVNPMKVYFNPSEQEYLAYRRRHVNLAERQRSEQELAFELILADGSIYPEKGRFGYVDREVDINTGTIRIVGLFPNPNYILRPGQFGRVRTQTQIRTNAIVVPQRAVAELQSIYQIGIVDDQNKAHLVAVKTGDQIGSDWIIDNGLKPGQRVIVEGAQKVRDGQPVNPKPFTRPTPSEKKNPAEGGNTNSPPTQTNQPPSRNQEK
ncbi:efflux RND transporter periplasmic adaptor subunit [Pedosphaera parvula]|uniref:Efflux transporter, RND family, MFP subunit n=1 Tax=Pedosphaera parvula (strain Ellin514) TaxID=320771 RepID=B9XBM2_PEDPL|nr:efflux RND transporter periplasmic adaptor subunit [Pedosphaera parvula]EEF62907.1 efflux transporter, RND family, MFP subunit [Pedosphaera parvula Ellin514]